MGINFQKQSSNAFKNIEHAIDKIPTRFDDISTEIAAGKLEKYYRQNEQKITSTYSLGNVLSEKLGKLLNQVVWHFDLLLFVKTRGL